MNEASTHVGIFQTDTAGLYVYTNSRWQSITGVSGEGALGSGWMATLHPADAEAAIDAWDEAIRGKHDFEMEFRIRTPEGEIRRVHTEASAMRDASGVLTGYVGAVQDITEREQAQDDAQRDAALVAAKDAELEAFRSSVSHDLQEPLRTIHAFSGMLIDDYRSLLPEEARTHLDRIQGASLRMKQLIADLRALSATSRLTTDPQPLDVATVLAAKKAEFESFTHSVTQDLQEPVRTIHALSGMLIDDYRSLLPEEARTHLDRIQGASVRMKQLIADLRTLSAASRLTTDPQPLDVATVLADVVSSLAERTSQTGAHVVITNDLPTVFADRTRLQQVFRNLIDNGIKYNQDPEPSVEIGVRSTTTNDVTLFVRDNGIGINERYHDRIFDIFQRLHLREEYDGTGAGLAIVKRAVEALNGRVSVESVEGLGSTFLLTLPIPNDDAGERAA